MRTVAMAIETLAGGGAERMVLELLRKSHEFRDFKLILLLTSFSGEYISEAKKICKDIQIISGSSSAINTLFFGYKLKKIIKKNKIDDIITHLTGFNRLIGRCIFLFKIKVRHHIVEHNDIQRQFSSKGLRKLKEWLVKREIRFLYRRAFRVIGVSNGVLKSLQGIIGYSKNCKVIYNPIPYDRVRSLSRGNLEKPEDSFYPIFEGLPTPIIISVGSLTPQKGFSDLISAVSSLDNFSGSLVILGEGKLREKLNSMPCLQNKRFQFHMPGFVANPYWYINKSDLYVMSSHWEGFPLALVESIFCEVEVISTDCNYGPREIITENTGRLIPVADILSMNRAINDRLISKEQKKSKKDYENELDLLKRKVDPGEILNKYLRL